VKLLTEENEDWIKQELKTYTDSPNVAFDYYKFYEIMKKMVKEKDLDLVKLRNNINDKKCCKICKFCCPLKWLRKKSVKASFNPITALKMQHS